VLVDEFQDTSAAQYQLVKLLALPRVGICCRMTLLIN
jgi:superfamily I DNA/RNA helicase